MIHIFVIDFYESSDDYDPNTYRRLRHLGTNKPL